MNEDDMKRVGTIPEVGYQCGTARYPPRQAMLRYPREDQSAQNGHGMLRKHAHTAIDTAISEREPGPLA